MDSKTFIHVGCGHKNKEKTTPEFENWEEIRFDIDESVRPDLLGSMTDMKSVGTESVDAIFSSHNIEHLYPHEVPIALTEFLRVLKPNGYLVLTCPDLQSVCALIAEDRLTEPAYTSPAGPIAPIDILFGHRTAMQQGNLYMAHRCGFTKKVLADAMHIAGFKKTAAKRRLSPFFDLWILASKKEISDKEITTLANLHFPS